MDLLHPSAARERRGDDDRGRGEVWGVHWERTQREFKAGRIIVVGPTLGPGMNTGICIFEAPDEEAARRFMDEDPVFVAGFAKPELRPFRVSLLRGRDGGPDAGPG